MPLSLLYAQKEAKIAKSFYGFLPEKYPHMIYETLWSIFFCLLCSALDAWVLWKKNRYFENDISWNFKKSTSKLCCYIRDSRKAWVLYISFPFLYLFNCMILSKLHAYSKVQIVTLYTLVFLCKVEFDRPIVGSDFFRL